MPIIRDQNPEISVVKARDPAPDASSRILLYPKGVNNPLEIDVAGLTADDIVQKIQAEVSQ